MGSSALRGMVSCVLMVLFPYSLFAADSNAATLYTNGPAWVNGGHVPRSSSAIFTGDLLQTRSDSVANINQPGSTVQVLSDSLLQFEGSFVKIDHGAASCHLESNGNDGGRRQGDPDVERMDRVQRHRFRRNGEDCRKDDVTCQRWQDNRHACSRARHDSRRVFRHFLRQKSTQEPQAASGGDPGSNGRHS